MNKKDVFKKELSYIKDNHFKENAEKLLEMLPDYFYEIAASSTGKYHPTFSLGDGGLVRHTKVAVRIAHDLLENEVIGSVFTEAEKDMILLALMVHDGLKDGLEKSKYCIFDHPLVIANFIKDHKEELTLTEEEITLITTMIESHMGQWTTNPYSKAVLPYPKGKYQKFVHMCDFLSSRKYLDVKFENNDIVE